MFKPFLSQNKLMLTVSTKTRQKGYWIFKEGKAKLDIDTPKRKYYKVEGESSEYSVIYDKSKNQWKCDCQFFSLKIQDCSHTIACRLLEGEKIE